MIRKRSLKFSFIITCCILSVLLAGCNDSSPPTFTLDEPDVDDISLLATLFVSNENPGGPYGHEGSGKLIDGDRNSKFLTFEFHEGFWMQQDFDEQGVLKAIFAHYMKDLITKGGQEQYRGWMVHNANTAWENRDPARGIMHRDYTRPAPTGTIQSYESSSGVALMRLFAN